MKFLIAPATALAALTLIASPALADDYGWTGFHVGAQLGYSSGDADYENGPGLMGYGDVKFNGVDGGIFAGYDHRFDRVVLGIGIDANVSDIDGDGTIASEDWCGALACGFDNIDGDWEYDVHATYSLRLRAGFLVTDNLLLYGLGGAAMANTTLKNKSGVPDDTYDPDLGGSLNFDEDHYGWLIGAGAEYAITKLVHVKGEFIYFDYGTEQYASSGGGDTHSMDLDMLTARLGVSLNF